MGEIGALLILAGGFFLGMIVERYRKVQDLRLDAENGVTFVAGVPHVFKRYGPEQNYDD